MYSKDSLLRLSFLINMGGGGEVTGHLQASLLPCTELTLCNKGFYELKKIINERAFVKKDAGIKGKATFDSAG